MKSKKVCEWKQDLDHCYYDTECKNGQYFSEGNIEDNSYKFCPYCGRKIKEVKNGK